MTKTPSWFGWLQTYAGPRVVAGVALLLVSPHAAIFSQSLPTIPPPPSSSAEIKHQLIIGAGAAGAGPGGPRVTMRVEYAPMGRQAILVGVSAEEQVGSTAMMLIGMPASHRMGPYRLWVAPTAAFSDEPCVGGGGGLAREFSLGQNNVVGSAGFNSMHGAWQWSMNFSFVNEKW